VRTIWSGVTNEKSRKDRRVSKGTRTSQKYERIENRVIIEHNVNQERTKDKIEV